MKICIFSKNSIGGSFLDWSIHYLSGQNYYYSSKLQYLIPLVENPISTGNAHKHQKNHPAGAAEVDAYLTDCIARECDLYSMYAAPAQYVDISQTHNVDFLPTNIDLIKNLQADDTAKMFSIFNKQQAAIIHLTGESKIPLYFSATRAVPLSIFDSSKPVSPLESLIEKDNFFFSDSTKYTDIWDLREKLALNRCKQDPETHIPYQHLKLDCQEFWHYGEDVMLRVMNYLGLTLDLTRFCLWKEIYYKWTKIHSRGMIFHYNCEHIVNCIVNNWSYEINLTFEEEVIVQQFLIYKHNLNLKTWQLKKFPSNTKQLHLLLEPNTHPITTY